MTQNPNVQRSSLNTYSSQGGKKSRRGYRKGGGAAPVHGLSVAKPTYYLTGGKTRKSKKRKNKRSKK